VVTLDSNTEIVLRNLVAYDEASGPLVLARYTELMNGIVDTDEDVAVLRARGVALNRMKSDGEAARMWNGMKRSVRFTKVAFVDRAVEEANRYYNGLWRVKTRRFMRKYAFSSWQLLTRSSPPSSCCCSPHAAGLLFRLHRLLAVVRRRHRCAGGLIG
jgi:hypothetical protein